MNLHEWAGKWRIPFEAVADLKQQFGLNGTDDLPAATKTTGEAGVQVLVRQEAARLGARVWRNNVGATYDAEGRFIRFGLANDSATVNARIKSADLIGIKPVAVTPAHIGHTIGQFVSREIKAPGWRYTGTDREQAQLRWAELVVSMGGDACFATGVGTI